MNNWDEIRSAAEVARLGTVSAAAQSLGVHRATVNRHIDSLEEVLGSSLFQRHAKGYAATELGIELLRVADTTEEQLSQLVRRAQSYTGGLTGELVVTSLAALASDVLPAVNAFSLAHPQVKVRYLCSDKVLRLEYGEAHVAFRAGPKPKDLDNIVQLFMTIQMGLFATQDYVNTNGAPKKVKDFSKHSFIGSASQNPRAPFLAWMNEHVADDNIRLRSNESSVMEEAILSGLGIGFLPTSMQQERPELVQVLRPKPEWRVPIWLVTHVDLHRSAKVQAFLKELKVEPSRS